jgi:hypothetical protein
MMPIHACTHPSNKLTTLAVTISQHVASFLVVEVMVVASNSLPIGDHFRPEHRDAFASKPEATVSSAVIRIWISRGEEIRLP